MLSRAIILVEWVAAIVAGALMFYEAEQHNWIGAGVAGIILLLAADAVRRNWRARDG